MTVIVCGSRDFADPFRASLAIDARIAELPAETTVIHGAARGADQIAAAAAKRMGHRIVAMPANWERYGKRAGLVRNLTMLHREPDLVIAFWNGTSRGTRHMIEAARERGVAVEIVSL